MPKRLPERVAGKRLPSYPSSKVPDTTGRVRKPLPPLSYKSSCNDIVAHLKHLHEKYGAHGDDWHLIDHPFGFKDAQAKRNWVMPNDTLDTRGLYTYTDFLRQPYAGGAKMKIGLFCTWTKTWVGSKGGDWKKDAWHVWACVVRKLDKGIEIIIWDSNWAANQKGQKLPRGIGAQRTLIDLARSRYAVKNVWMGGGGNDSRGRCVKLTFDWIKSVLQGRDTAAIPGPEEMAENGFTRLPISKAVVKASGTTESIQLLADWPRPSKVVVAASRRQRDAWSADTDTEGEGEAEEEEEGEEEQCEERCEEQCEEEWDWEGEESEGEESEG